MISPFEALVIFWRLGCASLVLVCVVRLNQSSGGRSSVPPARTCSQHAAATVHEEEPPPTCNIFIYWLYGGKGCIE